MNYNAYCDGSCIKKDVLDSTGNGGYAAIIGPEDTPPSEWTLQSVDGGPNVTNNQMEICALIATVSLAKKSEVKHLTVWTDSKYVCDGINSWVQNWERNNWRTAARKPVKNQELWQELLAEIRSAQFEYFSVRKVKGHSGDCGNEIVDVLAGNFARSVDIRR